MINFKPVSPRKCRCQIQLIFFQDSEFMWNCLGLALDGSQHRLVRQSICLCEAASRECHSGSHSSSSFFFRGFHLARIPY